MWLDIAGKKRVRASAPKEPLVATLGSFDGVHLGHQKLIKQTKEEAQRLGYKSAIITFSPHPAKVLRGKGPLKLTKIRQTVRLVNEAGIDYLIVLNFTKKMAELEPQDFVEDYLLKYLNVKHLVVGPFARIGKDRKGDIDWLKDFFAAKNLSLSIVEPLIIDQQRVSSNSIRTLVSEGNLDVARVMLGRPFAIQGTVIKGASMGRKLEFPTANIKVDNYVKPPYGVYICKARLGTVFYKALANFGVRPTFSGKKELLEVFFMDYRGPEFYKRKIEVSFIKKLRDEKKFGSAEELRNQLKQDLSAANDFIKNSSDF